MELGNQIKEYRTALKLTQDELAEKVFVTRQTVSNWENGKNYPDVHSLVLLSNIFDVSLDQLIKGDVEIMKEKINQEDIQKFGRDGNIFAILLIAVIVLAVPLLKGLSIVGAIIWIILVGVMLYFAFRVEKTKKENDIHTYREIVAFMDGEKLDGIEKAREEGKRNYQKVILVLASAVIALLVCIFFGFVLGIK